MASNPVNQLLPELKHVLQNVLARLQLRDLGSLYSTNRALRRLVQSLPERLRTAAEQDGLPGTLFTANPGSPCERLRQAASAHKALSARERPTVQCAPKPSFARHCLLSQRLCSSGSYPWRPAQLSART